MQDETIRQLEARHTAAQHGAREQQEEADDLRRTYDVADARITDLLQAQSKARRASVIQKKDSEQTHERLTAEIESLKVRRPPPSRKLIPRRLSPPIRSQRTPLSVAGSIEDQRERPGSSAFQTFR